VVLSLSLSLSLSLYIYIYTYMTLINITHNIVIYMIEHFVSLVEKETEENKERNLAVLYVVRRVVRSTDKNLKQRE
jgi:hypothetical protein